MGKTRHERLEEVYKDVIKLTNEFLSYRLITWKLTEYIVDRELKLLKKIRRNRQR